MPTLSALPVRSIRPVFAAALTAGVAAAASPCAHAQWTVTNLHPAGVANSYATGIGVGAGGAVRQVGYVETGGAAHAAMWSGTAPGWVDLHPTGAAHSAARAIDGTRQVGFVIPTGSSLRHACVWTGTAASRLDIHPTTGGSSEASGVRGTQVVGVYSGGPVPVASVWNDGATWASLGSGANAVATDGARQVGYSRTGSFPLYGTAACMWTGAEGSPVSMHPPGAYYSSLVSIGSGQQGGQVTLGSMSGPVHAAVWAGTAGSCIDLHPVAATRSAVSGVHGGVQVGVARYGETDRAAMWAGTAASYFDLHTLLPGFANSNAQSVRVEGGVTYIAGYGFNNATNRAEALLWRFTPPASGCDPDFTCDGNADQDDVACLINEVAGNPGCGCQDADFTGDGNVDQDDVAALINVVAGGACP